MKFSANRDTRVIALCMAKFNGLDQISFLKAFQKICERKNYKLFVFSSSIDFQTDFNTEPEEYIFNLMEPEKFDAVIIMTNSFINHELPRKIARKAKEAGTLCISLNEQVDNCVTVRIDFANSFELVVRHIIEYHGVTNVNFIAGQKGNTYSEERLAVFRRVMAENNLTVEEDRIGYGDFWEIPTGRVMDDFLNSGKKIDAIICANDLMAMEACRKLREAGLNVPDDVLVSGFDGIELEKFHYPRLATSIYNVDEAAEVSIDIMERALRGERPDPEHIVSCKFREGQSCGCLYHNVFLEGIRNVGIKAFEAHRSQRDLEANIQLLWEKVSMLSAAKNLYGVWGELYYLAGRYFDADFDLYINDDFMRDDLEIRPDVPVADREHVIQHYTDTMRVAMKIRDTQFSNLLDIKRENLVYDPDYIIKKSGIALFVPVYVQGSTTGYVMCNFDSENMQYFLLLAFINNINQIFEAHKERIDVQNLFSIDQLTGLLNRAGFYRHVESVVNDALNNRKTLCAISIDMNGLKGINDTYGHTEGDYALSKVGEFLRTTREDDCVCVRFGGDEFALVFADYKAEERSERFVDTILSKLDAENASGNKPYKLECGIGTAFLVPDTYQDLEKVLLEADMKMYKNKRDLKAKKN
ncbi:MAG: GGDEF domain-containing protein [Lachnospiraceae bacterium]|nr:GGDEF domain-containing protein [Lachnospiraceae bacterium]